MSFHGSQTLGALHIMENWVYATASARNAATGFKNTDVGKIAYQSDEGSYWRLTATTPTWQVVGFSNASPAVPQNWYFITALTGGGLTNLDGQDASKLVFGHIVLITISDSTSGYTYQNGAPVSAQGDIAVLGNAGARWRKTLGF